MSMFNLKKTANKAYYEKEIKSHQEKIDEMKKEYLKLDIISKSFM